MKKHAKHIYQFSLILTNVDDKTPNLEDSLYQAGCDDALINFRSGTVYLDFDREATSFAQAVIQAIQDVESSTIHAIVTSVAPDILVTESDVAKRLHIKRQTVSLWINGSRRKKPLFPKPVMRLSDRSPMWKWSEVTVWLDQHDLISDKEIIENAILIDCFNFVLEKRNTPIKKECQQLFKKIVQLKDHNKARTRTETADFTQEQCLRKKNS